MPKPKKFLADNTHSARSARNNHLGRNKEIHLIKNPEGIKRK
jgi:hypothetical protein